MNKLIKRRKANSISNFDLSTLFTKLPHNQLLMILNNLIFFCFNTEEKNILHLVVMVLDG